MRAQRSGPSVYARTYLQPRFQVAQVLTMRSGSLVVPVHLVSPSSQPHTDTGLVLSPSHVFIFLFSLRARMRNCSLLNFLGPPRGGHVRETRGITGNQLIC